MEIFRNLLQGPLRQFTLSGLALSVLFILHPRENSSLNYILLFCQLKGGLIISVLTGWRTGVSDFTNRCCLLCFHSQCACIQISLQKITSPKDSFEQFPKNVMCCIIVSLYSPHWEFIQKKH